jgi:tRNA (guanine-N7-)-methyltransferase
MSRGAQLRVSSSKAIPDPNEYVKALYGEFAAVCLDEEAAPRQRGRWRSAVFQNPDPAVPLDLEIGTGNGYHFAHRALVEPGRLLLGLELKYKPLIQSIRRTIRNRSANTRAARYNAALVHELFAPNELNDVFIHFPDPWSKLRQHKHRLVQAEFLERLWQAQRPGSTVEFKTDNRDYFEWALERFKASPYALAAETFDLHNSAWAAKNFVTQFESLFIRQGLPIHYALLRKSR